MGLSVDHRNLVDKYSAVKKELNEAEILLRKLSGGNRNEVSVPSQYQARSTVTSSRNFPFQQTSTKRSKSSDSQESPGEDSSEDEYPSKKAALQSTVVAKSGGTKSRKDVISKLNCNRKVQLRNRRIFGMVQSTLQKFQDEQVKRQPQDLKRLKVLEKVEAAQQEEKELIKEKRLELLSKTKEKQLELECLEKMMKISKSFELWETNQKYLLNFNLTKIEPQICFMPISATASSKKHLEKSRKEIKEKIEAHKSAVEITLANIKESYQLSSLNTGENTLLPANPEEGSTIIPVNTEDNTLSKDDSFQQIGEQVKKSDIVEEDFKLLNDETINSDLSGDESDFLVKMLY